MSTMARQTTRQTGEHNGTPNTHNRRVTLVEQSHTSCCTRALTRPTTLSMGHMMQFMPGGRMPTKFPKRSWMPMVDVSTHSMQKQEKGMVGLCVGWLVSSLVCTVPLGGGERGG